MNERDMLIYVAYACGYAFNGTHIIIDGQSVRWNPWQDTGDAVRVFRRARWLRKGSQRGEK